ncbi:MAG: FAD-dependent oxidoreductase, partial [Gammaproteobacteria bacterium]
MTDGSYHVGIIGGGIHGVGVAQRAAAQGYTVLVLEKAGLAAGTSSRSSKLIHGGLRYLESAQFGLVRECLRERSLLLQIAPELVRLQPFMVPVYRHTRRRPWQLRLGLSLYALLGGMDKENRFTTIPRRHWDQLDGLATEGLEKVYRYRDAQTDDALLTRAVMNSAQELGAELAMPANFLGAKMNQ